MPGQYGWKPEAAPANWASSQRVSLSPRVLAQQNGLFRGSGGVSEENRDQGFRPAFLDQTTGMTYLSRFADGRAAPLHLLDGLPDELVAERGRSGQVKALKDCVVAGFLRGGLFFTRELAAMAISGSSASPTSKAIAQ